MRLKVYKANMIIPQIAENLTQKRRNLIIPDVCPVCGGETEDPPRVSDAKVTVLYESGVSGKAY